MESLDICYDQKVLDNFNENLNVLLGTHRDSVMRKLANTNSYIFGAFILDCSRSLKPIRLDIALQANNYLELMEIFSAFAAFNDIRASDRDKEDYIIEYTHEGVEIYLHLCSDIIEFIMSLDYSIEMIWYDNSTIIGYNLPSTLGHLSGTLFNYKQIFLRNEKEISKFRRYIDRGYIITIPTQTFDYRSFVVVPNDKFKRLSSRIASIKENGISYTHATLLEDRKALYDVTQSRSNDIIDAV